MLPFHIKKIHDNKSVMILNIHYHAKFCMSTLAGATVVPTSEVWTVAMLVLLLED
jgi:hypothetical protein